MQYVALYFIIWWLCFFGHCWRESIKEHTSLKGWLAYEDSMLLFLYWGMWLLWPMLLTFGLFLALVAFMSRYVNRRHS